MVYLDFALRGVGIFGSGAFFGQALAISTVTLPMLFRHKDITARQRVELWSDLYDLVYARWVPFGVLSSVAFGVAAYNTKGDKTLPAAAAASMFSIIPLTFAFVFPYVHKLKAFLQGDFPSDDQALKTMRAWGKVHWLRTIGSGLAAAIGLYDLVVLLSK